MAIATFRRPDMLRRLLESLAQQSICTPFDVVVVDNDPEGSAEGVAEKSGLKRVRYLREDTPGIAAARNRCLDATQHAALIAFVDDDESVPPDWLETLITCLEQTGGDIVAGPVIPSLPEGAGGWIAAGGYFDRPRWPSGTVLTAVATNNTLMKRSVLGLVSPPGFSSAFGSSGGSDTEFFARALSGGATAVWCDEAAVVEHIPPSRLRLTWVIRRGVRVGNSDIRRRLRQESRSRLVLVLLRRTLAGLAFTLMAAARGRAPHREELIPLLSGVGGWLALAGFTVNEYRGRLFSRSITSPP